MSVFKFADYRAFLAEALRLRDGGERGSHRKLASHLNVHTSLVSRILGGKNELTPDQAFLAAEFLRLAPLERDYFIALVNYARAGNPRYRSFLKEELQRVRREAGLPVDGSLLDHPLTQGQQALFYSRWYYSAIRLLSAIPEFQTQSISRISKRLGLSQEVVRQSVVFLLDVGLCLPTPTGIRIGTRDTLLTVESKLLDLHLSHWFGKAVERLPRATSGAQEVYYCAPMAISKAQARKVREILLEAVTQVNRERAKAEVEELFCLSLAWFTVE